jgi:hypothetical protein
MSKNQYVLLNPSIDGKVKTKVSSKTSGGAMKKIWGDVSQYFSTEHPIHEFYMTIYNKDNGALHHFVMKDQKSHDDGGVIFHMEELEEPEDLDKKQKAFLDSTGKKLIECYDKINQEGGSKKKYRKYKFTNQDDSSSSSDSDSDSDYEDDSVKKFLGVDKYRNSTIGGFTYYAFPYNMMTDVDNPIVTLPVFIPSLTPKVVVTYNYGLITPMFVPY